MFFTTPGRAYDEQGFSQCNILSDASCGKGDWRIDCLQYGLLLCLSTVANLQDCFTGTAYRRDWDSHKGYLKVPIILRENRYYSCIHQV